MEKKVNVKRKTAKKPVSKKKAPKKKATLKEKPANKKTLTKKKASTKRKITPKKALPKRKIRYRKKTETISKKEVKESEYEVPFERPTGIITEKYRSTQRQFKLLRKEKGEPQGLEVFESSNFSRFLDSIKPTMSSNLFKTSLSIVVLLAMALFLSNFIPQNANSETAFLNLDPSEIENDSRLTNAEEKTTEESKESSESLIVSETWDIETYANQQEETKIQKIVEEEPIVLEEPDILPEEIIEEIPEPVQEIEIERKFDSVLHDFNKEVILNLSENSVHVKELWYLDDGAAQRKIEYKIPQEASNLQIYDYKEELKYTWKNKKTEVLQAPISMIPIQTLNDFNFILPAFKGTNVITIEYDYNRYDYCDEELCFFELNLFAEDDQRVQLKIESEFNILSKVKNVFLGKYNDPIAYSLSEPRTYCKFKYTEKDKSNVRNFEEVLDKVCDKMGKIEDITGLPLPDEILLNFAYNSSKAGNYVGSNIIYMSSSGFSDSYDKIMYKELTRMNLKDLEFPAWLDAGIPEYTKFVLRDEEIVSYLNMEGFGSLEKFPYAELQKYLDYSAYVVHMLNVKHGSNTLKELIQALLNEPDFNEVDSVDLKNFIILKKMKEINNNPELTLENISEPTNGTD